MSTRPPAPRSIDELQSDERLGARAVIARVKEVLGVSTDAELGRALHASTQTISKWKARNSIPYAEAVLVSLVRNVSLDYLLTGEYSSEAPKLKGPSTIDVDVLRAVLVSAHDYGFVALEADDDDKDAAFDVAANAIAYGYQQADEVIRELVSKRGLTAADAKAAAIIGTERLGTCFAGSHALAKLSTRKKKPRPKWTRAIR